MAPRSSSTSAIMQHATARSVILAVLATLASTTPSTATAQHVALSPSDYEHHFVEGFPGPYLNGSGVGAINRSTFAWATTNLPLFDASDPDLTAAFYFRAKTYKAHLNPTEWVDLKYVSSEFGPSVPWGGVYGSINAAAGHQIREGRWVRDREVSYSLLRFWIGSQAGGGTSGTTPAGAFEPGIGHYANGTRGTTGNNAYSSWILSASLASAAVRGDLSLGLDIKGHAVSFADVLPLMVSWWETRSLQLRVDCRIRNAPSMRSPDRTCLDNLDYTNASEPLCYTMADGWDAMEGSVSGFGCRPTIGAMMIDEALSVATVANLTGNATLGATFTARAAALREWYLANLWNEDVHFFSVFKEGLEFTAMGGCTSKTLQGATDGECCCVPKGENVGHYLNFSVCPDPSPPDEHAWPGNASACRDLNSLLGGGGRGRFQCGKTVPVRELLGLGPAYYHGIVPHEEDGGAGKYDVMWESLFDADAGFWGEFGPTTVERGASCFNKSQDMEECNWAGPSWPYETSRVLSGLARFLIDYPAAQSAAAGVGPAHYTRLLRAYARSMTQGGGVPVNGSLPWVGENIDADSGLWLAHSIMYRGGNGKIDPEHPWLPAEENPRVDRVNCSVCEGTCWDREWSADGRKCNVTGGNWTLFKEIGPCDLVCSCVPPAASYDYTTHSTVACCHWGPPQGSCEGKRMPTFDKDRGKDYNHSTPVNLHVFMRAD